MKLGANPFKEQCDTQTKAKNISNLSSSHVISPKPLTDTAQSIPPI